MGEEQLQAALQKLDSRRSSTSSRAWLRRTPRGFSDLAFIVMVLFFMGMDATRFSDRLRLAARVKPDIIDALPASPGVRRATLSSPPSSG